ncbi:LOW QUALITY PROTEIN: transcription initiation factor TFIID subunit 7-like [Erethizon dorsatum]
MNKSQDELPRELENQFILRVPPEHASTVRNIIHSGGVTRKDKIKIDLSSDGRHAVVEVANVSLSAKLVDLPCVVGSLKTFDKKNFYKTGDISQMLVCSADGDLPSSLEEPVTSTDLSVTSNKEREIEKEYIWKHGVTTPLKNVRKKRFQKTKKKLTDFKQIEEISFTEEKGIPAIHGVLNDTTDISSHTLLQYTESPDVEKEVKRLLRSDTEAVRTRWEVIGDDETKKVESQGYIPSLLVSPGMSGHKQGDTSSGILEEEEEEEDDDFEEALERELQAKIIEYGRHETKEGASSIVREIQKHIHYKEKKLQEIQKKAQRQRNIIRKVENLTLKNHLKSVLENLKVQEKQKNDQVVKSPQIDDDEI